MNKAFPHYSANYADYLGDLRSWVFRKQIQAANFFSVSHTTIGRYENGKLTPPIHYLIALLRLVVERFEAVSPLTPEACQAILEDVNTIIQNVYPGQSFFNRWADLMAFDTQAERQAKSHPPARLQWSAAPKAARFYGRQGELDTLHRWVIAERRRLIALLGIGGIGKTSLAAQYCLKAQPYFDEILWVSLRNAPPPGEVLTECIRFFSNQQQDGRSNDVVEQISAIIDLFHSQRCLLVIDNFESVLLEGQYAGAYRSTCGAYGDLLRQVGESDHQSCVIVTSREKPKEVLALEETCPAVRSLVLSGLGVPEARQILSDSVKSMNEPAEALDRLVGRVAGNPLALQWMPALIDLYAGDIDRLLEDGAVIAGDIFPLLQQQFQRLSPLEADILFWLAVEREAVPLKRFQEILIPAANRTDLANALLSLNQRSLLERSINGFSLQNLVMEYVTYLFISRICEEITSGDIHYFNSHALDRVQTHEFITQAQDRLIVQPIAQHLLKHYGKLTLLQGQLARCLEQLRQDAQAGQGYAAGNIVRLLSQLGVDLAGTDFSHLALWDVDLRSIPLHQVNLSGCDLSRSAFTEVFGRVLCLAFSPAGEMLAAGTTEGEILVIRTEDFSLMLDIQGHTDWVRSLAFDPSGRMLMSCSDDGKLKLWDMQTGQCFKTLLGHTGRVMTAVFHPNRPMAASGGEDGMIRLWNTDTGLCETTLTGHTQWIYALCFTADGTRLVSTSSDETLKVWDTADGQASGRQAGDRCLTTLTGHTGPVWTLALSPAQTLLASSGGDKTVRIWRLDTGEIVRTLPAHPAGIRAVAFSPDSRQLAVPSSENIYIYSVDTGALTARLTGHTSAVWAALYSPDGRCLASAGHDKTVRFWSVQDGQCLFTLKGYHKALPAVAFDPTQAARLVTGCDDGQLRLWDASTGQCLKTIEGHTDRVKRISFSADGRFIATAGDDACVQLWDGASAAVLSAYPIARDASSICFDRTGSRLITSCTSDSLIHIWDTGTGQLVGSLDGQTAEFYWLAVSPDNRVLAAAGETLGQVDGNLHLWDLDRGVYLGSLDGHRETVWALAFTPDRQYLVSGGADGTVRVWDYREQKLLRILPGHTDQVKALAISPPGDQAASAGQDSLIRIWDTRDFSCTHILTGHTGAVLSLGYSADGQVLCSTGADETLRLWEAKTGRPIHTLKITPPYQGMNITGVTGIHPVQKKKLCDLGAVEQRDIRLIV